MRIGNDILTLEVRGLALERALVGEEVAVHFSRSIFDMILFSRLWDSANGSVPSVILGPLVGKDRWLVRKVGLCARSGIICNSESDGELVRVKAFTQCHPRRCEDFSRTLQTVARSI